MWGFKKIAGLTSMSCLYLPSPIAKSCSICIFSKQSGWPTMSAAFSVYPNSEMRNKDHDVRSFLSLLSIRNNVVSCEVVQNCATCTGCFFWLCFSFFHNLTASAFDSKFLEDTSDVCGFPGSLYSKPQMLCANQCFAFLSQKAGEVSSCGVV